MELHNAFHPVSSRSEERCAEVQRVLLLSESRSRDHADSSSVEETQAVELVGLAVLGGGGLDSLGWEGDLGEKVHGALDNVRNRLRGKGECKLLT